MKKTQHCAVLFFLSGLFLVLTSSYAFAAQTTKDGTWGDSLSWEGKLMPSETGAVTINHQIWISGTVKTGNIVVGRGGELIFSNSAGLVTLTCANITVLPGGKILVPSNLSGCYLTCLDVQLQANNTDTAEFVSNCGGMNFQSRAITNDGVFKVITSNYLYVNGNITNNGLFEYTGNGLIFEGDSLVQQQPKGLLKVSHIKYQFNWSNPDQGFASAAPKPLYLNGNICCKDTKITSHGGMLVVKNDSTHLFMDGGELSYCKAKGLILSGKNKFLIAGATLIDCVLTDTVECNTGVFAGNTTLNGVIYSKGFNSQHFAASSMSFMGHAINNGVIENDAEHSLLVSFSGSMINNGTIRLKSGGMVGYYQPAFINNNLVYSSMSLRNDSTPLGGENGYVQYRSALLENNGIVEGNVVIDSGYVVTSTTSGRWSGVFAGKTAGYESKTRLYGTHHFIESTLSYLICDSNAQIMASRTAFSDVSGQMTPLMAKSGCSLERVTNMAITANGTIKLFGKNSGSLVANDSLIYYNSGFTGYLTTNALVSDDEAYYQNTTFGNDGVWVNNGTITSTKMYNSISVTGSLVNNGVIDVYTNVSGQNSQFIQNGSLSQRLNYLMKDKSSMLFWMVKPESTVQSLNLGEQSDNTYKTTTTKNGVLITNRNFLLPTVADTGVYVLKAKSPGTYASSCQVTLRNPYQCVLPVAGSSILADSLKVIWPSIPGAMAYKVRLVNLANPNEPTVKTDSTLQGDTTLIFRNLKSGNYQVVLSARFANTWSFESAATAFAVNVPVGLPSTGTTTNNRVFGYVNGQTLVVSIEAKAACAATLRLCDLSGKTVYESTAWLNPGQNILSAPFKQAKGIYVLEVIMPGEKVQTKVRAA